MTVIKRPRQVVSGLMCLANGKILMGKRKNAGLRPGLWETPGGKIESWRRPTVRLPARSTMITSTGSTRWTRSSTCSAPRRSTTTTRQSGSGSLGDARETRPPRT